MPCPLPAFLKRSQVRRLFQHWQCGGETYLDKLISHGILPISKRPLAKCGVIPSEKIIEFYQTLL